MRECTDESRSARPKDHIVWQRPCRSCRCMTAIPPRDVALRYSTYRASFSRVDRVPAIRRQAQVARLTARKSEAATIGSMVSFALADRAKQTITNAIRFTAAHRQSGLFLRGNCRYSILALVIEEHMPP